MKWSTAGLIAISSLFASTALADQVCPGGEVVRGIRDDGSLICDRVSHRIVGGGWEHWDPPSTHQTRCGTYWGKAKCDAKVFQCVQGTKVDIAEAKCWTPEDGDLGQCYFYLCVD